MSFGKRHYVQNLTDLSFDLQADIVRLVGLVGLWMIHLDLRGGRRQIDLKHRVFLDLIAKNARKFDRRPLVHAILTAAHETPFPAPLPGGRVVDHVQTVFAAMADRCDPLDTAALRVAFMDMAEGVLRVPFVDKSTRDDPFFATTLPLAEKMRHMTRRLFHINDQPDRTDLSVEAQLAMQALVSSLGAEDLWHPAVPLSQTVRYPLGGQTAA